jgi:peptidoglycan/LPS O-acetylase OafA/YrhL
MVSMTDDPRRRRRRKDTPGYAPKVFEADDFSGRPAVSIEERAGTRVAPTVPMRRHVPALDGLRAIAICLVLLAHFWNDPPGHPLMTRVAAAGWIGVDLFFVLSGFLITGILLRTRTDEGYYSTFYARRTLRIFPLYYLVLAVIFGLLPLVTTLPATVVHDRWLYFFYLSNVALAAGGWQLFLLDITWSLAIEEQFYLAWPAIVRWTTRHQLQLVCVAILALVPVARLLAWPVLNWRWVHMLTPFRLDALAMGALLAIAPMPLRRARLLAVGGGAVLLALILGGVFARDSWLAGTLGYSLLAVTSGAVLTLGLESRWLAWRPLTAIGTISYGLYLTHPLTLSVTSSVFQLAGLNLDRLTGLAMLDAILALSINSAAAMSVATASYLTFERPFLRLKARFAPQSRMPSVALS